MPTMMHISAFLMVLLSLSFTSFFMMEAHAQGCIDLIGSRWSKSYIGVYIASGTNDVQRRQVLFALQVWWAAQNWFIDSFTGRAGIPWLLYLTDRPDEGAISVSFFIGQGVDFGGRAITEGTGEEFTKVRVQINLPPDRAGNPDDLFVESVILHELGHAMGLGHTQIEGDAMNGAIDTSPQNFGLPSTLDLYALYRLSQSQPVGELGGAICLPSDVGYGLPPWVEQRSDGTVVLSIPSPGYGASFDGSTAYPQSVFVGESATFTTTLMNHGHIPMSIVSAIATSDFGGPVKPNELLPLIIEPLGQRELTHTVAIPVGIGAGTHSLTFHIEVTILTIEGWSSQRTSSDQTVSFTVEQPQMTFVVTQPTAVIGTEIISVPTMPTSGPSASTYEWVPLTILLVALIVVAVGATWYGRSKRAKHPKEPETVNIFCVECGAQNPTTNEYCGKCGNSLVARPTH